MLLFYVHQLTSNRTYCILFHIYNDLKKKKFLLGLPLCTKTGLSAMNEVRYIKNENREEKKDKLKHRKVWCEGCNIREREEKWYIFFFRLKL